MKTNQRKKNKLSSDKTLIIILSPLMALMAPFLVWGVEQFLPFPYLVEEAIKAIFAYVIISRIPDKTRQILFAVFLAVLFSLSETVLYLFNLFQSNTVSVLFLRLILTTSMHTVTIAIMVLCSFVNKKLFSLGIILAVIVHYFYNLLVVF